MFCFKYTNAKVLSNNMVNFMMIFFSWNWISLFKYYLHRHKRADKIGITNDSFLTQRDDPELLSNCRDILKRYWFTVSHKGSKNAVTRFYTLFIAERITALEYYILLETRLSYVSRLRLFQIHPRSFYNPTL